MRKIKRLLTILFLGIAVSTISAEGADIVVLMDSSGTILPWFDEINNRILVDITKKFVREGDTFHLISFNSRVNLEITQQIESEADISRIVSRFMLLYPLGQNSDFLSGLQYVWQYVSALEQQRDKIVIVISDGIFNPPQSSQFAAWSPDQIRTELTQIARKIRGAGWNVYYIKLPFPQDAVIRTLDDDFLSVSALADATNAANATSATESKANASNDTKSGDPTKTREYLDVSSDFASDLDIPRADLPSDGIPITFIDQVFAIPEITFPRDLGKKGRFFVLPIKVKNISDDLLNMELTGVFIDDGVNVLAKNAFLKVVPGFKGTLRARINLPENVPTGKQNLNFTLGFSNNLRVAPQSANIDINVTAFSLGSLFMTGSSIVFSIIIIVIALLLVAFLILFILRRTEKPAAETIRSATAFGTKKDEEEKKKLAVAEIASSSDGKLVPSSATSGAVLLKGTPAAVRHTLSETGYTTEKKQYVNASSVAKSADETAQISALSASQQAERAERLAVLANAAVSSYHMGEKRKGADAGEKIDIKGSSRILLELVVDNQNQHVGKRNIHMMGAGSRLSIGGGQSSFLVFLVKFPARIAEIRFDGQNSTLAILKPEYFPYEKENIIPFGIDRKFTIISDKEHEVTFGFRVYEDPVLKLNRLLQSINY
jgi:hypothetical protein